MMLKLYLLVFIGGGLGSMARFAMARLCTYLPLLTFPIATFGINVIGSFAIGLLWAIPSSSGKSILTHLLIIGFCGGFTTFSAFSWENLSLIKQGQLFLFFVYALLSVTVCLLATWGGYATGKGLFLTEP